MVKTVLPQDLTSLIHEYERELNTKDFSAHTKRAYISRNKKFLSYLYEMEGISTLQDDERDWSGVINSYREFLKKEHQASLNSVNNSLTAIEDLFNHVGIDMGRVEREAWPKSMPRSLTQHEQEMFLNAVYRTKSSKDKAIVLLILNTGIKIGECAALDISDIYISAHAGRITVKDGRIIPLNTVARRALIQWLIDRHKKFGDNCDRALFVNPQGKRISTVGIDLIVRKIGHKAHLNLSAQVLRDTCLSNLVKNGNDLLLVAQIGGHRTIETTRRYTVGRSYDAHEAMEALGHST